MLIYDINTNMADRDGSRDTSSLDVRSIEKKRKENSKGGVQNRDVAGSFSVRNRLLK